MPKATLHMLVALNFGVVDAGQREIERYLMRVLSRQIPNVNERTFSTFVKFFANRFFCVHSQSVLYPLNVKWTAVAPATTVAMQSLQVV